MNHPNLSDDVNSNIAQSEIDGGVWFNSKPEKEIKSLFPDNKILYVQTKNTLYQIKKENSKQYIKGNARFCPDWTECHIHGSTLGGSIIKVGFIGRGMYLEFSVVGSAGTITTTMISDIYQEKD